MSKKPKPFVLSDENVVNSYGFYVSTEGMKIDRFLNNPVMLDTHSNTTKAVLGKWEKVKKQNGQVIAFPVFDYDDPEAASVAGKVERGFINGASVGILFQPENLEPQEDGKFILTESELIEASICAIPSNPNSLQFYIKGKEERPLTEKQLKEICLTIETNKFNTNMTLQQQLIPLLGLESTATDELILEAVTELVKQAEDSEKLAEKEAEKKLSLAIKQGKITPLQKKGLLSFAKTDPKGFNDMIDNLPAKHNLSHLTVPGGTRRNSTQTEQGNEIKPKSEWNLDDYRKYAPKELVANPELYKELINLKYQN